MPSPTDNPSKADIWASLDSGETTAATGTESPQPGEPSSENAQAAQHQEAPVDLTGAAAAAAEADPYEGLPEAVKHELVGLKTLLTQANTRIRQTEGHIGGLKSQLNTLQQAAKDARDSGASAPTAAEVARAQGSSAAMAKLREDYPEFGEAVQAALSEQAASIRAELTSMAPKDSVSRAEFEQAQKIQSVEVAHPGWQERIRTPAFSGWLQAQPREVQLLAESESPRDAIRLLDLHSGAAQATAQVRTQRLGAAAAIPSGRAPAQARGKPVEQMTKAELWAHYDNLEKAKKG